MQKKKVPVGLVVALCALLAIGVIANGSQALQDAGLFQKKQEVAQIAPTTLSEEDLKAQKEALRASVRGNSGTDSPRPIDPDSARIDGMNDNGVPNVPAIFIKPEVSYKPVLNDSSTAGQWWNSNHRLDKKAKEVAAGKK